jgi:hypothetical protein
LHSKLPPCWLRRRVHRRSNGRVSFKMSRATSRSGPLLCAGATAVSDRGLPPWQRATGTLVLVHEAYHLRRWKWRRNEAKVECQAIRHFVDGAERLGASPELANDLLPYALAAHARMVTLFPEYRDPRCKLPVWTLPMTP